MPVVAWGGGSGTQGGAVAINGGLVVDLRGLDTIVEIDDVSMTVTAQAGVNGNVLERTLNARGLMLPHYPASSEWATVGGYVAARGSGVLSTRYGKIEDLVLGLRVALPNGTLFDSVPAPRHAVGPDLTQLFVGSEGTLGIITRATLEVVPLPAERSFVTLHFPTVEAGVTAFRTALARGNRPSVIRMYDEEGTRRTLSPVLGVPLDGVMAIVVFEGERAGSWPPSAPPPSSSRARRARASSIRHSPRRGGTAATTSTSRPITRSCRRSGARSTSSPPTRASTPSIRRSRPPSATATRRKGSSCGCTSRTGTAGAR